MTDSSTVAGLGAALEVARLEQGRLLGGLEARVQAQAVRRELWVQDAVAQEKRELRQEL